MILEGFTYMDGLYYSVTTILTIGFGDVRQTSMLTTDGRLKSVGLTVFVIFWIYVGLVIAVANLLMIFSVKMNSHDVIKVEYIDDDVLNDAMTDVSLDGSTTSYSLASDSRLNTRF